jgi:hypothetical protein
MTIKNFRKNINESEFENKFKEINVEINYPHLNFGKIVLKDLIAVYSFLIKQNKGWESSSLPSVLNSSKEHFKNLKSLVLDVVNGNNTEYNIDNKLSNIKSLLISQTNNANHKIITSDSSEFHFLKEISEENSRYVEGAYDFLFNIKGSFNNLDSLTGFIKAYEFRNTENDSFSKRRVSERAAISKIKSSFENYVSEREKEISEVIDVSNKNLNKQSEDFVTLIKDKDDEFYKWFDNEKIKFDDFFEKSNQNIIDTEIIYRKKLQLEAPARYWQKKSTKHSEDAKKIRTIIIWVVSLTSVFISLLLVVSPDWIFKTVFGKDTVTIVRWSILFLILISLIAYSIKALTKMMFSSYHLARDAEERHTLTFFYLALLKDTDVSEENKKLILQSLFSRTDTGLLKDDSGPTMPSNDILSKLIK